MSSIFLYLLFFIYLRAVLHITFKIDDVFFVPDEEKYEVFLRTQKNVVEAKPHKGRSSA